jgi:hypothetical protein
MEKHIKVANTWYQRWFEFKSRRVMGENSPASLQGGRSHLP